MNKIFNMASQPTEKVISENGEVYESSITDEQRAQLSTLLVDLMNAANRSQRVDNEHIIQTINNENLTNEELTELYW